MATLPASPQPAFNLATLLEHHTQGTAAVLVAMLRPGGAA